MMRRDDEGVVGGSVCQRGQVKYLPTAVPAYPPPRGRYSAFSWSAETMGMGDRLRGSAIVQNAPK